ncbi:hypothetical protein F5J12DRAFT_493239 [Pisolithus orientalis]|uniref:uncharacterized protein n=1 Tax=Pisolithus orientalis TaxID=936130 RepID=UPI0022255D7D|nr:uncharacterized protein F5J12DRAFT_493239 [Pisolithus orientalis]KAI6019890.1 hypothetical protein F5J12DRAFT_493239 [Pisolithus orientalis]
MPSFWYYIKRRGAWLSWSFVGSFHLISVIAEPRVAIPRLAKQTNQRRIGGGSLVVVESILCVPPHTVFHLDALKREGDSQLSRSLRKGCRQVDCWQDSGRCHPLARPSVQVANSEVRTKHYHHRRMNFGAHGSIRPPIHRPPCRVGPDSNPKFVSALPFSIATPSLSFHSNRYYRLVTGHIDKKKHVHIVLGTIHSCKHRVRIWLPSFVLFRGREGSTSRKQYYERHH